MEFLTADRVPAGTFFDLLRDAYAFEPRYEQVWGENWRETDDFFVRNPEIARKYGFVTVVDGLIIGFMSWDPRRIPDHAEIGHNCVRQAYKGRGYGKAQLLEAVRRIEQTQARKIIVTTNENFAPARANYEGAGFYLVRAYENPVNPEVAGRYLDYERPIRREG